MRFLIFGLFLALSASVAESQREGGVPSQCYVNMADGSQIAVINAGAQRTREQCARIGIRCANGAPYRETVWTSSAVIVPMGGRSRTCDLTVIVNGPTPPPRRRCRGVASGPPHRANALGEPIEATVRSGMCPSGERAEWSPWYRVCSRPLPAGYRIVSHRFVMRGDRRCNSWGRCRRTQVTPDRVCYRFQMQGHNERCTPAGCVDNRSNGQRDSEGVLRYRAEFSQ